MSLSFFCVIGSFLCLSVSSLQASLLFSFFSLLVVSPCCCLDCLNGCSKCLCSRFELFCYCCHAIPISCIVLILVVFIFYLCYVSWWLFGVSFRLFSVSFGASLKIICGQNITRRCKTISTRYKNRKKTTAIRQNYIRELKTTTKR